MDWTKLLPSLFGLGLGITSTVLQNNSRNTQNSQVAAQQAYLNQLAAQDQARKNYYSNILMPNILRGLGQSNPQVLATALNNLQTQNGGVPAAPTAAPNPAFANTPAGYAAANAALPTPGNGDGYVAPAGSQGFMNPGNPPTSVTPGSVQNTAVQPYDPNNPFSTGQGRQI